MGLFNPDQPQVPIGATPGTLPQRTTKPNQPTARSERIREPRDCRNDRADSCDHRSPAEPRQWVTHCETLLEIARNDPTFADCTAATRRWGTPPSRDGVEPSRLRLDSTISPRRRRRYPLFTVRSTQSLAPPHHPNQKRRGEETFTIDH